MSLKIISKQSNESITDFWSRIETETGTTVEWALGSDGTRFGISKITFSDGNYVDKKNESTIVSGMDVKSDWVLLIDDSNHLFILTQPYYMNNGAGTLPPNSISSCWVFMILDLDGIPRIVPVNSYWRDTFNIPYGTNKKPTAQTIKILPAYIYTDGDGTSGYSKNLYINYDRAFDTGLKFVDQNNNEFITIGGYLLYYNGKHK